MDHLHPDEPHPAPNAEEELALEFYAEFRAFERALLAAGFRKTGPRHTQGLPDWEGFARQIERRFDPHRSPVLMCAVAYLLGISVKTLDDRDSSRSYPPDRRFYHSDTLWLAMVIRAAGRRLSHVQPFLSRGSCDDAVRGAALLVLGAWAEYVDGTGRNDRTSAPTVA